MNNAVFFDNDCPKYATFFEASNDTVDCKGAMPISSFGLKGDRFCENICSGVSYAIHHTFVIAKKTHNDKFVLIINFAHYFAFSSIKFVFNLYSYYYDSTHYIELTFKYSLMYLHK